MRLKIISFFAATAIFVLLILRLLSPINLTAVDIGRHITNGALILEGQRDVFSKNFYSFTHPDYPFINHHWFFGVCSFLVWKQFSFAGLDIVYILVMCLGLLFFWRAALLRGHFAVSFLCTCIALPLLWDRQEIRPEGVSILCMGFYFYMLTKLSLGQINRWIVFWLLLLTQIIWVNTHIFFFMGPLLVILFLWEGKARGCSVCVKQLWPLLFFSVCVNLINPNGLAGALTPLNIFKGLGYRLAENQNVFFMMAKFYNPIYPYFLGCLFFLFLGILFAVKYRGWRANLPFICLSIFVSLAGLKAIRLIMPFGFFCVALAPFFWAQVEGVLSVKLQNIIRVILLICACIIAFIVFNFYKQPYFGLGLMPGINASADFFKGAGLKGPIFSNYDIGGYLIFHLAGKEKVFVDNRQEAFPREFFKETYVPMQENQETWARMQAQYGFNAIFFYRRDLTPWGQTFLIARVQDPEWAPVFVDDYTIIFLKHNVFNQSLITRFELPKSMFKVSSL